MRHAWSLRATLTKRVCVVKEGGEGVVRQFEFSIDDFSSLVASHAWSPQTTLPATTKMPSGKLETGRAPLLQKSHLT